jgi:predicted DsbA family dithiol-disulfide isomerase
VRTDRLSQSYHVEIQLVHYPLHPETPAEGQSLERLFPGRSAADIAAAQAHLKGLMTQEGLPYGDRSMTYNSRLAQELASYAVTREGGEGIHDALFRAYFVDGVNIAEVDQLVSIAAQVGLDAEESRAVLVTRRFRAAVSADWERSRQAGVTGVPTYVAAGLEVVGAQPYEVLERLALDAGAAPR